jgi:hypothetical protein
MLGKAQIALKEKKSPSKKLFLETSNSFHLSNVVDLQFIFIQGRRVYFKAYLFQKDSRATEFGLEKISS